MDRWNGRVALVTGASAGIGAGVVRALVGHGVKVAACARNLQRLEALKDELSGQPGSVLPIQCDLRDTDAIEAMFTKIKQELGGVDILVNNAGLNHNAPLLSGTNEEFKEVLMVNVLALTVCTREAVQSMLARGVDDGHVINISSMSAHRIESTPFGHFYAGTKHAVKALTEGLRHELLAKGTHIRVTSISPGNVATEFTERMFAKDKELQAKMVVPDIKELDVSDIVDALLMALSAKPHCSVHDILIRPVEQRE